MKVIPTELVGAYIIEPQVFGDARGWFTETFSVQKLRDAGIDVPEFVQDNHSYSAQKGVVRGLHCQLEPHAQTKLFRCTRGELYDVIVDVREGSPTYKKWIKVLLTAENKRQLYIPRGFLHGFVTLTNDVEVQYKVDRYYDKPTDRSVRFDDPALGVDWGIANPILSEKDEKAPLFADSDVRFFFGKA